MLLACANGVIDLSNGDLLRGAPSQFIRTVSPTTYNKNARRPIIWLKFLEDIFAGNQEVVEYIQRLFGYSLMGKVREHIFPICWGIGRNGKGTLFQAISYVLGPTAGLIKSSLLLDQGRLRSSAAPNPDILDLRGKRMVWASETNEGAFVNTGVVKLLVGGDILVGRAVYGKHEVRFEPSHTLFLMTNHKPRVKSGADDFALWQRVHLIPFTESFVESPQNGNKHKIDRDLPEKLKGEAEGILLWLVDGCLKYQREGLCPPEVIMTATKQYQAGEDVLSQFIDNCCVQDPNYKVRAKELYNRYKLWAGISGFRIMGLREFGEKMRERFQKKKSDGIWYQGLKIGNDH